MLGVPLRAQLRVESPDPDRLKVLQDRHRKHGSSEEDPPYAGFEVIEAELQLTRLLGTGGFGSVYQGLLNRTPVAVKKLHACTKNERARDESYRAELNVLFLKHKNIVRLLGSSPRDNGAGALIVMEYVGEVNLQQRISNPRACLGVRARLRHARDISRALCYIHTNNVIHLDVKPSNVLLTARGVCKLGDFGCCQRAISGTGMVSPTQRSYLTGTFAYRAPELLRGEAPSFKADIYSIGVTLWQMLSRENPYGSENQHVVIFGVVAYNLRPDSRNPPDVDDDAVEECYRDLYRQCWEADFDNRPSAADLQEVLELWYRNLR